MSRYPNRDRMRRFGVVSSNPSILFDDPTLGTRSVIEQAAGINQVLDPGMSFGTPPILATPHALNPLNLPGVGIDAALQAPDISITSDSALPSWVKPAAIATVILLGVWWVGRSATRG